jgi:hypothetical protein
MKLFLLAAAAVIATPALAQTSGSTGTSSPTSNGGQGTPTETRNTATDSATTTTPNSAQSMPSQSMSTQSTADQSMSTTAPMPAAPMSGGDPVGGYQPATPAMSGGMQPGATVTFQPAPSPDQAYPAPAPLARYPVCKPGQFDDCIQRGSSRSSSRRRR